MSDTMTQTAPYPHALAKLVSTHLLRPGYIMKLEDSDRGQGCEGLTLWIRTAEMDTYNEERRKPVWHLFPVPAAAYNERSWRRWLFDRFRDVTAHEDAEFFREVLPGKGDDGSDLVFRPFAPLHGEGNDPYVVHELATDIERRTLAWGPVSDGSP
jgi:hypothetical protein